MASVGMMQGLAGCCLLVAGVGAKQSTPGTERVALLQYQQRSPMKTVMMSNPVIITLGGKDQDKMHTDSGTDFEYRLNWQKAAQCKKKEKKEECTVCESVPSKAGGNVKSYGLESPHPKNCWFGHSHRLFGLEVDTDMFSTFKSTTHISCEAPNGTVQFALTKKDGVQQFNGGTLQFFLGTELIANFTEAQGQITREIIADPTQHCKGGLRGHPTEQWPQGYPYPDDRFFIAIQCELPKGSHTLTLQFNMAPDVLHASVHISDFSFVVNRGFESCVDTKVCLQKLGDGTLRINNAEQLVCLEAKNKGKGKGKDCKKWRKCLKKAATATVDHRLRLITLLKATQKKAKKVMLVQKAEKVKAATALMGTRTRKKVQKVEKVKGSNACIDPYTADPEEWDCDCFPLMKKKCDKRKKDIAEEDCMRSLICQAPTGTVCQQWKDDNCPKEDLLELVRALQQRSTAEDRKEHTDTLDESASEKCI